MKRIIFFCINTFVPLASGICFYALFTQDTYISTILETSTIMPAKSPFFVLCRYYLCDMLWSYALMYTLCVLSSITGYGIANLFLKCIAFEAAFELLQHFRIISGTCDILDIVLECIANLLAIAIWKYIENTLTNHATPLIETTELQSGKTRRKERK